MRTLYLVFLTFSSDAGCLNAFLKDGSFLTRELRACARASYRYDVGNAIRSLDWSIPVNFF